MFVDGGHYKSYASAASIRQFLKLDTLPCACTEYARYG